jgi:predicted kinase
MITRGSKRTIGEASPIISDIDEKSNRVKRLPKTSTTTGIPGTEYVSNFSISDCETDSDGLKGEVFAQFVYNKLKNIDLDYVHERPKVFIMMGPPGAGKSTIKRQFDIKNYVNIDLDEIKKLLQKCFPDDRSIQGFGIIYQLKRLAKYLLDISIRENMNILFDTTGRMKEVVSEVINKTSDSNYEIQLIIISTSRENCLQRAEMRNKIERDREPMEPFMINGAYDSFMEKSANKGTLSYYLMANPELLSKVNQIYIFDNNYTSPELLFKKVGENVEIAQNYPNLYNMSINSSPPYFSLKSKGGRKTKKKKNKLRRTRRYQN